MGLYHEGMESRLEWSLSLALYYNPLWEWRLSFGQLACLWKALEGLWCCKDFLLNSFGAMVCVCVCVCVWCVQLCVHRADVRMHVSHFILALLLAQTQVSVCLIGYFSPSASQMTPKPFMSLCCLQYIIMGFKSFYSRTLLYCQFYLTIILHDINDNVIIRGVHWLYMPSKIQQTAFLEAI